MRSTQVIGLSILCLAHHAIAQPPDQPEEPPAEQPEQPPEQQPPPAQTTKVRGRVINSLGKPVRGAKVSIEGSSEGVRTGGDGWFRIDAPIGATLVIEAQNYEVGLAVVGGAKLDDTVLLTPSQASETIEVSGEAPPPAQGAAKLDRKELQRVPGTGGDIVRALTVMPGVVNLQIPLGYSGVVIRGSSPQDSTVLIDDFEVPVLFHNIGFRAIVPAEAIDSLDFIPGGFDVSYGRASSGIVLLTTRPGGEARSTQAEVSLIDGGLVAQGPIGKDTRYMFALRRSTIDFLLPSLIPESVDLSLTTVPSYYDEQFRIDHRLNSKWRLAISSVGTIDTFELYATKDTDADTKRYYNRTMFARLTAAAHYHDGPWTAKLALSGLLPDFLFEAGVYQRVHATQPTITPRAEVIRTYEDLGGLTNVEWKTGTELRLGYATIDMALPVEQREGENYMGYDPRDTTQSFMGSFWLPDWAAWSSLSANLDPRIRATVGVREDYFGRFNNSELQPRGDLKIRVAPEWTVRLSAGAYRRPPEFQSEYLFKNLKSERATQTIAGVTYEPHESTRLQASAYYTDRTSLITHEMNGELGNSGRGTTVGAEFLGTYRNGPWFGWLSYSYSNSVRVDHPGDPERLFTYDQPHSLNAAASWKQGRWQLGGRFQLYSGLPYTPALGSLFDSDRNVYIPLYGDTNSERAPLHHQLDLRVDYSWKWGPTALTAFLDVQNVYMNESVVTYFYGYDFTQRAAFKSLPIIPSIGLRGIL